MVSVSVLSCHAYLHTYIYAMHRVSEECLTLRPQLLQMYLRADFCCQSPIRLLLKDDLIWCGFCPDRLQAIVYFVGLIGGFLIKVFKN